MRNAITGLLFAGATSALLATSAFAQVAGNPGDLHTPTPYTNEVRANTYGYTQGSGGPLGVFTAPFTAAPVAVMNGAPGAGGCGVSQDFNGRLTALCGL
jgi:hypothetical protein